MHFGVRFFSNASCEHKMYIWISCLLTPFYFATDYLLIGWIASINGACSFFDPFLLIIGKKMKKVN